MSSVDELKKACEAIITNKLLDAERVKCQIRTLHDKLTRWGCGQSVCTNDEFWDILERLHKLGQE